MKSYTDLEQSKKLLSLGLNPSTADMCYVIDYSAYDKVGKDEYNVQIDHYGCLTNQRDNIPCWSLTALLELMPSFITIKEEGETDEHYHFQLNRNGSVFHSKWWASYRGLKTVRGKVCTHRILWAVGSKEESETPIDAAFEMVCWLIEQGHIKVNK